MDKEELTEGQIRLFLKFGTIPAGYTKEEMIKLTEQGSNSTAMNYAYEGIFTKKHYYHFCEICDKKVQSTFIVLGERYPGRYRVTGKKFRRSGYLYERFGSNNYCYICHKSMCDECKAGIVCKNCIEFFPETTQNEIMKRHNLISKIKIIFAPIILLFFISFFTDTFLFPNFEIPTYVYLAFAYTFFGSFFIIIHILRKYLQDTTEDFFKDLKENPQNHGDITKKVYALYYDSYDHPENLFITKPFSKRPVLMVMIVVFLVILLLFAISGS